MFLFGTENYFLHLREEQILNTGGVVLRIESHGKYKLRRKRHLTCITRIEDDGKLRGQQITETWVEESGTPKPPYGGGL